MNEEDVRKIALRKFSSKENRYIKKRKKHNKRKRLKEIQTQQTPKNKMAKLKIKKSEILSELLNIAKWGASASVALLISSYIIVKLSIVDNFLSILLAATIISITIQAIRSQDHKFVFRMRWFIFYFITYVTIIWATEEFIFQNLSFQNSIFSAILIGFIIAIAIVLIKKIRIRHRSVPWISFILFLILLVSNMGYVQDITKIDLTKIDLTNPYQNSPTSPESEQRCPTPTGALQEFEASFTPNGIASILNNYVDASVWRVENLFSPCYKGKYTGQNPNWYYCDDMIVSRWETSSSGTINYRWYTAITAEFSPKKITSGIVYSLEDFTCENGQKVTVNKGVTDYYVYDSRDGRQIRIKY